MASIEKDTVNQMQLPEYFWAFCFELTDSHLFQQKINAVLMLMLVLMFLQTVIEVIEVVYYFLLPKFIEECNRLLPDGAADSTSCRLAAATICPAPVLPLWAPKRLAPPSPPRLQSADCNVAGSHGQYVPTLTAAAAWRVNVVSKAAWWPWPLTFWPWKWCPSHVWRGLPLCQF